MTTIRFRIGRECRSVSIRPLRRYIDQDGIHLAIEQVFPLALDGTHWTGMVDLAPTSANPCWVITEDGPDGLTRCVSVPEGGPGEVLDYEDLVDVDPAAHAAWVDL